MDTVEYAASPFNNTMHTSVEVKSVSGLDNNTDKNSLFVRYVLEQKSGINGWLAGVSKEFTAKKYLAWSIGKMEPKNWVLIIWNFHFYLINLKS